MTAISATEARRTLFPLLARVVEDHEPVEIVGKAGNAVLISKADYDAMVETEYLTADAANRAHLEASVAQADRGETAELDLSTL